MPIRASAPRPAAWGRKGAPVFWRLVAQHGIAPHEEDQWRRITKLLALLTPASATESVHEAGRPLGAVLADGGEARGRLEKPVLSEQRLARLLAARGQARRDALERAVRALARNRPGVDVPSLAWAVLNDDARAIARAYYTRLDHFADHDTAESAEKETTMTDPRFLQIHFLAPYTAALLNRDDAGLAKRLPYGGALRTRVSSQCLKRHWRLAEDPHALTAIDGADAAYRSREIVEHKVFGDWAAGVDEDVAKEIKDALLKVVYGDKGADKKSRQTLLLGEVEVAYLTEQAKALVAEAGGDKKAAKEIAAAWLKEHRANLKALSEGAKLPGGLTGALFGRMVTSDPRANIDAAVHVAHAFTVHAERPRATISSPPTTWPAPRIPAPTPSRKPSSPRAVLRLRGHRPARPAGQSGRRYGAGRRGVAQPRLPYRRGLAGGQAGLHRALQPRVADAAGSRRPAATIAGRGVPRPCPPETGQAVAALADHLGASTRPMRRARRAAS